MSDILNLPSLPLDQKRRLFDMIQAVTPWRMPLYRAVNQNQANLVEVARGATRAEMRRLEERQFKKPVIVLIGDDDYLSSGPSGFPCVRWLVRYWARAVLLHSTGGEPSHYEIAVDGAKHYHRVLLIETNTAHHQAWAEFIGPRLPVLEVEAPPGEAHPDQPHNH